MQMVLVGNTITIVQFANFEYNNSKLVNKALMWQQPVPSCSQTKKSIKSQ